MAPKPRLKNINKTSDSTEIENKPKWPPFDAFRPLPSCSVNIIHPNQIITIPNFWSSKLCNRYISFLSTLPLSTTPTKAKKGDAVRVNDRFQVQDSVFAERLWSETFLRDIVLDYSGINGLALTDNERKTLWRGDVIGLNPNIRIYRYKKGQYFNKHYDESNSVVFPGSPPLHGKTTWTFLLYLSSPKTGCLGGETVFYPEADNSGKKKSKTKETPTPIVINLDVGMALLHSHGSECLLHEGKEVTDGEKWVIRSDLCVRA